MTSEGDNDEMITIKWSDRILTFWLSHGCYFYKYHQHKTLKHGNGPSKLPIAMAFPMVGPLPHQKYHTGT